jgi:hypothetical protein
MEDSQINLYQSAVPAAYGELAKALEKVSPLRRDQLLNGQWELEVPALRVEPKVHGGDQALFVGSANGVFTTYVGNAAERVYVQPVDEQVPSTDPCTGGPKPIRVLGVRLVDEKGRELMLQVRP